MAISTVETWANCIPWFHQSRFSQQGPAWPCRLSTHPHFPCIPLVRRNPTQTASSPEVWPWEMAFQKDIFLIATVMVCTSCSLTVHPYKNLTQPWVELWLSIWWTLVGKKRVLVAIASSNLCSEVNLILVLVEEKALCIHFQYLSCHYQDISKKIFPKGQHTTDSFYKM